jgi:hypothetical protein
VLQRGKQRAQEIHVVKGENGSCNPCLKGRGPFIDRGSLVTLQLGLSYMTIGAQRRFIKVGRGFLCILLDSRALRWRVPGMVLGAAMPGDTLLGY